MMHAQALSDHDRFAPDRARGEVAGKAGSLEIEMGEQALSACRNRVYYLCLGFIGNAADALDLTQDTFARALLHYHQDRPEHVQAWIMRIARNLCLDHLRCRKSRGQTHPLSEHSAIEWQTPEDLAGAQEDIRIVRRAIAKLPSRLRDVLLMREYGEFSYHDIGRALRIGRGTVTSRLNRARQAVVRSYQEEHHERRQLAVPA